MSERGRGQYSYNGRQCFLPPSERQTKYCWCRTCNEQLDLPEQGTKFRCWNCAAEYIHAGPYPACSGWDVDRVELGPVVSE